MPMERRRSWRVATAGLGLFALLLQLALSFGHIHLEGLRASLGTFSDTTAASAKDQNTVAAPDGQKKNSGHSEDDCPICSTMHMAAAGAQPIPPVLFVPFDYSFVLPPTIVEKFLYRVPKYALFQTRAPPAA
jgi:hypothetical protein